MKITQFDNENYGKKYKPLNKKKVLLKITEVLIGSGSAITTSTRSLINPCVGMVLTSSTAVITTTANLITKEFISNLKIRYAKLTDWTGGKNLGLTDMHGKGLRLRVTYFISIKVS